MPSNSHLYAYARASGLSSTGGLDLQTSGGTNSCGGSAHPRFFTGFLAEAEPAAVALLALANVAGTRYYQPRPTGMRDPVVTCDGERLRFEAFSACCGVYARLDVLSEALDGEQLARGTTNVDMNHPLQLALARVRGADPLRLEVGSEALAVTTFDGIVVERKVPLPYRWMRGFAEVQAICSGFDPRARLAAVDAARFLRTLPKSQRGVLWVLPSGRSLRITSRPASGAVGLSGTHRLKELLPLMRFGGQLTVYGPGGAIGTQPAASAWQLDLPGMRLTLALSPEVARGFSGEGAVLTELAEDTVLDDAETVGALLDFQGRIDPDALAETSGLSRERVRAALTQLGTAGQVGYDVAEAAFFHRELPYDALRAAKDNPRLAAARSLVDVGAVNRTGNLCTVRAGSFSYQIRFDEDRASCTCRWWAEYTGGRGPCTHILAAALDPATDPQENRTI
ncbi:SWIM zinc finger family protein [Nocardia sp. NBC_01009]|uniref:SWIM zinc finger family protein n=1 Tax=Nocardia sp. NBC_01009 TaxID=2975996 RepID=UPI003869FDAC|nr:SWIM zinc finger domain-containing protein [Nocardia sp. NBC_01009]